MMKFVVLSVLAAVTAAEVELDLDVDVGDLPMQNPDLFRGDVLGFEPDDRNVIPHQRFRWMGKTVPYVIDPAIVDLRNLPMQNPDLFQGDILGFEPGDRNVIPYQEMRWTAKTVPYVIDASIANNPQHKDLIQQAIQDYHTKTCVRFTPRSNQQNYIRIFPGDGCYSNVGMIGGQQPVSLGDGCMYKGTIVHEFGHAIGFYHEQNRSDRDQYLIIYWDNIQDGLEFAFVLLKPEENLLLDPFDYDSVMLYGNTAFSKDGRSFTMAAKNGRKLIEPYDKPGLSASDVRRVNKMYSC